MDILRSKFAKCSTKLQRYYRDWSLLLEHFSAMAQRSNCHLINPSTWLYKFSSLVFTQFWNRRPILPHELSLCYQFFGQTVAGLPGFLRNVDMMLSLKPQKSVQLDRAEKNHSQTEEQLANLRQTHSLYKNKVRDVFFFSEKKKLFFFSSQESSYISFLRFQLSERSLRLKGKNTNRESNGNRF